MMNELFLIIGGNLGDRKAMIADAKMAISKLIGEIINASSIYETDAWGVTDQPAFLNQVLQVSTPLSAQQVLSAIHQIEKEMGRVRVLKYGARTMDIDILFYGQEIINEPHLIVPHAQLSKRNFVLVPLAEIAGCFVHPVLGQTVASLLKNCVDTLDVRKFIE